MTQAAHQIYFGSVFHQRKQPLSHSFRYRVFTCLLDLDELETLRQETHGFAYNRFGLFSFHDRDHGARDGSPLRPWVEAQLADQGLNTPCGRITLLCYPRILGYVFNPLSVYYCYDEADSLFAVVCEVKNTFGEQHVYVCRAERNERGQLAEQKAAKDFHVSPFIDLDGQYTFRFQAPGPKLRLEICHEGPGTLLLTGVTGTAEPLSTRTLFKGFFKYPLMTLKVIGAIHFEAFRLWRKGAKVYGHPKHSALTAETRPTIAAE